MGTGAALWLRKSWFRLTHWEFWPFNILYFPIFFYYFWQSLKRGTLFYFKAANPHIDFGGMLGEKKSDIYAQIPAAYLPKMGLFSPGAASEAVKFAGKLDYPVIAKPDIGERGRLVEKIRNEQELRRYVAKCQVPFLLQEFVSLPVELAVMYVKRPGMSAGKVTSLTEKQFMKVRGNGRDTVKDLLQDNPRALLQLNFNHPRFQDILGTVPKENEEILVESIGNHCRGTIFINRNQFIDDRLNAAIEKIAGQLPEFHFGRFDLRCSSIEDLKELKNVKILELNGAGAEPGHIYHPGYPLWRAYHDILWHLKVLSEISAANKKRGFPYGTFREGFRRVGDIRRYNRLLNS